MKYFTKRRSQIQRRVHVRVHCVSEKQVDGIANHFRDKMCAIIAKLPSYESGRIFTTQDLKNAFAEVLAKRILHIGSLDEEPVADEEKTEDEA